MNHLLSKLGRKKGYDAENSDDRNKPEPKESYEMVKRRAVVNLAILERPLMTKDEFIVDVRYRHMRLIGSGSYGLVVKATDTTGNSTVAIKKILRAFSSTRMARHVLREVRLLRHLHHPNIVRLLDIDVPGQYSAWDSVYIVTPLLKTDLKTAMKEGQLEDSLTQKRIAYQILLALEHMHSLGLMHRDIKSRNVLLDERMNAQLCDLGESRFYSKANRDILFEDLPDLQHEPQLTGVVTTMLQSAPELSLGADYDAEVDIWAAGCVIAELIRPGHDYLFDSTVKHSHLQEIVDIVGFPTLDIVEILPDYGRWFLKRIRKSDGNRIAELLGPDVDPLAVELVKKMLLFSPKRRISAKDALKHSWFDEVRTETVPAEEAYDFCQSEPPRKTSKSTLKQLVWGEVVAFHPEAAKLGIR
ncbi:Mitogen-activated protein kinase 10 MPK10 [Gracilaria domingensis]|nr:Mitogen-activated protein kinase 10 MPK10 [Gracilaria domingensis]